MFFIYFRKTCAIQIITWTTLVTFLLNNSTNSQPSLGCSVERNSSSIYKRKKLYRCSYCNYSDTRKSHLLRHIHIAHDKKNSRESEQCATALNIDDCLSTSLNSFLQSLPVHDTNVFQYPTCLNARLNNKKKSSAKKRKTVCLDVKLQVIKKHERGMRSTHIARFYDLHESTVRSILKNAHIYKEKACSAGAISQPTRNRSVTMLNMERLLSIWIEDCIQKRIMVSTSGIKQKALSLFASIKESTPNANNNEKFSASNGWFERYKTRSKILDVISSGGAVVADRAAALQYKTVLQKIIEDGGYCDRRIFSVAETTLFWKRLPAKACISKGEKFNSGSSKENMALLLGGNAEGDLKLKPMLVYRSENPRALKNYVRESLPVIWRSNKRAWINQELFTDWFINSFCPSVEKYCEDNNLSNKVLLLLDTVPCHPTNLNDVCENVDVIYLPPNTSAILHPFNRGLISAFKAHYLRGTFLKATEYTHDGDTKSLLEFLKFFTIKDAIDNVASAWNGVSDIKSAWKYALAHCDNNYEVFAKETEFVVGELEDMGKKLGFDNVNNADYHDLLNLHSEELSNEELLEIEKPDVNDFPEENSMPEEINLAYTSELHIDDNCEENKNIAHQNNTITEHIQIQQPNFKNKESEALSAKTVKSEKLLQVKDSNVNDDETIAELTTKTMIDEIFNTLETLKQQVTNTDPNTERSKRVCLNLENELKCYRQLYEELSFRK